MRVGIVGCGLIGKRRAEVISHSQQDVVVVAADADLERAQAVASETGCLAVSDWQAVTGRDDLDAVVVATPNKYLLPASLAALRSGKHVLCEKPPGRNAGETQQMVEAAQAAGRVLKVGFNHRYHPAIWKAHEFCQQGAIGELMFMRVIYGHGGRPGYDKEWRGSADLAGGGELLDQGVHILDLCRWFLVEDASRGNEFTRVYGCIPNYFWELGYYPGENPIQMEDNAFVLMQTAAGQTVQFHTSWTQWKNRFSLEVLGKKGYVRVEGLGGSYGKETLTLGKRRPESGPPVEEVQEFEGPDLSWKLEWEEFSSAIQSNRQPLANGGDGLETMRLLADIYRSARSGQVICR